MKEKDQEYYPERRKKMPDNSSKTLIRMDLWGVLGFLVLLVGIGMGWLFNAQADNREERLKAVQVLDVRVTIIETNYRHILQGVADLKYGQDQLTKSQKELADEVRKIRK